MKIRKHDFVLIDDELKCRLHKVVDMKIKIKKNYLNLIFLVNKKYGSTYTYLNNKWVRSKKKKNKLEIDFQGDIKGTNKDIFQNANSQKLTEENILELKENPTENPYEVIKQLVDNSSTYKDKTVISKFKYIEKKLKRHLCQFTVYECSIVNLVNFYYKYFPEKISSVRVDYLSYLLFHLNRDVLLPGEGDSQGGGETAEGEESTQMFSEDTEKFDANHLHTFSTRKPNVIIYDDSFGLLTSTLNIIYAHHVNIFSLIYKNASNSIIPSFGIPKSANIAKVSILHASHATRLNTGEWLAIDARCELVGKGGEAVEVGEVGEAVEVGEVGEAAEAVEVGEVGEAVEVGDAPQMDGAPEGECRKRRMDQVDHVENLPCPAADQTADPTTDAAPPANKRAKNAHEGEADEGDEADKADEADSPIAPDHPPQLQHMLIDHMNSRGAEAFVAIISSDFIYSTNTDVCLLVDTLIKVALKFLKNDSKLIIHTDDLNVSSLFLKGLMDTGSFINVKLNEFLLREQQVVKRRTHPVIKNAKLADGFLLTALKVEGAA